MIGLARNIDKYKGKNIELLESKIKEIKENKEYHDKYSGSQSHNAKNVMGRIDIAEKIFKNV